ncbi:MAG: copper chaperone PCu(A)C [Aeromicrobium sp.]
MTRRLGALLVALALVLAGCGGSLPSRSDIREKRINDPVRGDSVSARVGDIRLLAVHIEQPVGAHAADGNSALFLTLVNDGDADRLVAVSSVDARSVVARDGSGEPTPTIDLAVAARAVTAMQSPYGVHLELVELKRDLGRRAFVPVTFRFAEAGSVTAKVLVSGFDRQVVPTPSASG